jgi:hypothetical protein
VGVARTDGEPEAQKDRLDPLGLSDRGNDRRSSSKFLAPQNIFAENPHHQLSPIAHAVFRLVPRMDSGSHVESVTDPPHSSRVLEPFAGSLLNFVNPRRDPTRFRVIPGMVAHWQKPGG